MTVIGADKTNNTGLEWLSDFTKAEIKIKLQFANLLELDAEPVLMATSAFIPNIFVYKALNGPLFIHVKLNITRYCTNIDANSITILYWTPSQCFPHM